MECKEPVAFFFGKFPLNEAKWFTEQVTSLIDLGVDVHIFAFHHGEPRDFAGRILEYKLIKRTTYLSVPTSRMAQGVFGLYYFFKLLFRKPLALKRIFDRRRDGGFGYALKYLFWTAPLVGKINSFPIIHCHFGMIANRYLIIKDILGLKQPFLTTFYGQDSSKFIKAKGVHAYDRLKKEGEYLLTMTEEMKERMIRFGFPRERVLVHYTGILLENYAFIERKYVQGTKFKIVFVGRFVEKKGILDFLRAVALVVKKYKNIEAHIIGGGDDKEYNDEIDRTFKREKLEPYVTFHGLVPGKELPGMLAGMHLMLHMAKTAKNGDTDDLPVAILDGQASGLPVITTRHVGTPDGVLDKETGFLVDEGDFTVAAEKIIYLMEHPEMISKMSVRARKFMEERFDLVAIDKILIKLYSKILKDDIKNKMV